MKLPMFTLIFFSLIGWLAACTPQTEPAYDVAAITATDKATPAALSASALPPALVLVTTEPTRAVKTPTAVLTETPAYTPTALPPTTPAARETPTNVTVGAAAVETAVAPTLPPITTTWPTTPTLPNAQTPTPGWHYYVSDPHGLLMQVPDQWQPAADHPYGLDGSDGFMRLYATNSQDNLLPNACQDMAMGTTVPVEWLTVAGQEACLVTTDDGTMAMLIVTFPELRENIVPGVAYAFLVLQADPAHMPGFVQTLHFVPVTNDDISMAGIFLTMFANFQNGTRISGINRIWPCITWPHPLWHITRSVLMR
jgi:hypothetical protein